MDHAPIPFPFDRQRTLEFVGMRNIKVQHILGGCTSVVQTVEVGVYKTLKDMLRDQ